MLCSPRVAVVVGLGVVLLMAGSYKRAGLFPISRYLEAQGRAVQDHLLVLVVGVDQPVGPVKGIQLGMRRP